jgi:hypothetical protein
MDDQLVEVVKRFFRVRDKEGIAAVADMLAGDYQRHIDGVGTVDKQTYLAGKANAERALTQTRELSGFVVDGNVVTCNETVRGVITAPLDLSPFGLGVIDPNGRSFVLPDNIIKLTVVDGKISRQQDPPPPPGKKGYELLLDALGLELPNA